MDLAASTTLRLDNAATYNIPKHLAKEPVQKLPAASPHLLDGQPQPVSSADWATMGAMKPEVTAYPAPSTAGVAPGDALLRDTWPCTATSVRLDETCGLLDQIRGLPKHLASEPVEPIPSASPRQASARPQPIGSMNWMLKGAIAPDITTYPAPPTAGAACGPAVLRDDPLGDVLPRARPDAIAEALADAIYAGEEVEVRRLITAGAGPNLPPVQGRHADVKPLALAVRGTRTIDIVRLLLESGAVVCPTAADPGLNAVMQAWTSAFVDVVEFEAETRAKLRLLLEYRADISARVAHTGDTALHWAASEFQRRRAEGASPKINRWTTKRSDCAKLKFLLLLQARADPSIRNRKNQTPLDLVSANFRSELPSPENACQEPL